VVVVVVVAVEGKFPRLRVAARGIIGLVATDVAQSDAWAALAFGSDGGLQGVKN